MLVMTRRRWESVLTKVCRRHALLSVPSFFTLGSAKSSFMPVLALGDEPPTSRLGTKTFSLCTPCKQIHH